MNKKIIKKYSNTSLKAKFVLVLAVALSIISSSLVLAADPKTKTEKNKAESSKSESLKSDTALKSNQPKNKPVKAASQQEQDSVIRWIKDSLVSGQEVELEGLGKFYVGDIKAHTRKNAKTGKTSEVSAKKVVRFKAAKEFKQELNN